MAKAAFSNWNNRIAVVFDVSRSIQLVVAQERILIEQVPMDVTADMPSQKVLRLVDLNVDTLVCGAISQPLQSMMTACGIEVIAFVAGELQEVIQAWIDGKLTGTKTYAMPGCRKIIKCNHINGHRMDRRMMKMKGNQYGNQGSGQRSGHRGKGGRRKAQRQSAHGQSSSRNFSVISALDVCICPNCGYSSRHERGTPCKQIECDQCGAVMTKQ
jgi:predicted Fe-Mo cluster-binding NifX family protein